MLTNYVRRDICQPFLFQDLSFVAAKPVVQMYIKSKAMACPAALLAIKN